MYSIVLIGDHAVGKTAYIHRILTNEFLFDHHLSCDVSNTLLTLYSSIPVIVSERGRISEASGLIVMFDVSNEESFEFAKRLITIVRKMNPLAPIVLCGNKTDVENRVVLPRMVKLNEIKANAYTEISVKTGFNLEKPFTLLSR